MGVFEIIIGMFYMALFFVVSVAVFFGMFLTRMPKHTAKIVGTCGVLMTLMCIYMGYKSVEHSYNMYHAESACVAELVALGIERKDIVTSNGHCYRR